MTAAAPRGTRTHSRKAVRLGSEVKWARDYVTDSGANLCTYSVQTVKLLLAKAVTGEVAYVLSTE